MPAAQPAARAAEGPEQALELRPARLHDLAVVRDFVARACEAAGASAAACDALVLAADEVCANVLLHGYRGAAEGGPLRLAVRAADGMVLLSIADEAPRFDPATAVEAAVEGSAEERAIGGLGWHLVRRSVDEVRWRPAPGGNEVTLVKRCRPPEA